MARALTAGEKALVRWILMRQMSNHLAIAPIDLDAARVTRYDESECLRFVVPPASDAQGCNSPMLTFEDRDGTPVTAFLTFDPQGRIQELDLWKGDDTPIIEIPLEFSG